MNTLAICDDFSNSTINNNNNIKNSNNSPILQLPAEVLAQIFSLFTNFECFRSIVLTCQLFKWVVFKYHAFDASINGNKKLQKMLDLPQGLVKVYIVGIGWLIGAKGVDPSADDNKAIWLASRNGHVEVVRLLLGDNRVNPSAIVNYALREASEYGHVEVVKVLLANGKVDPTVLDNWPIRWASYNGHVEVVKVLLTDPRVDPSASNNYAIRWASQRGHVEVVKALLADRRVSPNH